MREKIGVEDIKSRFGNTGKEDFLNDVIYPLCEIYGREFDAKTVTLWYDILKRFPSRILAKATERVAEERKTMPTPANLKQACKAIDFEESAGQSGKVTQNRVVYVCRDGRAVSMWKAMEAACKNSGLSDAWNNWMGSCAPHRYENGELRIFTPSNFVRDRLTNSPPERRLWQRGLPDGTKAVFVVFEGEE